MIRWLLLLALGLALWRALRPRHPRPPGPGPSPRPDAADPYAVLGVRRGASADEIAQAYRQAIKQYHPDRVEGLGPELRELAHRKTLEIQRAYEQLRR